MEGLTYNIKKEPKCKIELDISVDWVRVNTELEKVYEEIKREARIPGFRVGKVPINVIKERYGDEAKQELVSKFSPKVLGEVLEKEKINPATTPKIKDYKIEDGQPFKLNVAVEVYPDVQLKKYKKIKLEKKEYPIKEKDIEETIENLRERNTMLKAKDGNACASDYAVVSSKIYMDSKEVKLGLPQEILIEIGGSSPMPGFDENIKGMKKGEKKEFKYKFPDDFQRDELKGKEALFNVEVKEVKEKKLPGKQEIAESLGFGTIEKLNDNVRESLQKQMERASQDKLEEQIIEYLIQKHDMEIPEGLVEESLEKSKKEMAEYIQRQGGDASKIDESKMRNKAVKEIKAGILLSTIAHEENIKVGDDDRKNEEEKILKLIGEDNKDNRENAKKYVNDNAILTRKVFDFIKENAKIKTTVVKSK